MLFFKQIMAEKLKDRDFKKLYDDECHICATTAMLVGMVEDDGHRMAGILEQLNIPIAAWKHLKAADHCDPVMVHKICCHLGLTDNSLFEHCPRMNELRKGKMP